AVAVAVGLRAAAGGTVAVIEESSLRALAKLEQVLPARLRHRVQTLGDATVPLPGPRPTVAAALLTVVAAACRACEQLRFDYRDHGGATSRRTVEPYHPAHPGRLWSLVPWDLDRRDWRPFRADRIEPRPIPGDRFRPRPPPDGDMAAYVRRSLAVAPYQLTRRVTVQCPPAPVHLPRPGGRRGRADLARRRHRRTARRPDLRGHLWRRVAEDARRVRRHGRRRLHRPRAARAGGARVRRCRALPAERA